MMLAIIRVYQMVIQSQRFQDLRFNMTYEKNKHCFRGKRGPAWHRKHGTA
jgi:hypothetical protein